MACSETPTKEEGKGLRGDGNKMKFQDMEAAETQLCVDISDLRCCTVGC